MVISRKVRKRRILMADSVLSPWNWLGNKFLSKTEKWQYCKLIPNGYMGTNRPHFPNKNSFFDFTNAHVYSPASTRHQSWKRRNASKSHLSYICAAFNNIRIVCMPHVVASSRFRPSNVEWVWEKNTVRGIVQFAYAAVRRKSFRQLQQKHFVYIVRGSR